MTDSAPLVIWRFTDGKPGHENQSMGLALALASLTSIKLYDLEALPAMQALKHYLGKSFPIQQRMPPALIIGVGHTTHLSVLAAQRSAGGRSVILMKPSLPCSLFDWCVIPEHDRARPGKHVITSTGVLNRIRPSATLDAGRGLILIGGPSTHYDWHDVALIERIGMIVSRSQVTWQLTTSRRTPDSFVDLVRKAGYDNLQIVPFEQTGAGWVAEQLKSAAQVWVSEDSVSMVYEALTAGAACGLLPVERKKDSRVSNGIDDLLAAGRLTAFDEWMRTGALKANTAPLDEARRIAELLLQRV